MMSQQQFMIKLKGLKRFKFVSYYYRISKSKHLVSLFIADLEAVFDDNSKCVVLFIVEEVVGGLSAVSLDGSLIIGVLS